jgi:hypothetical protein
MVARTWSRLGASDPHSNMRIHSSCRMKGPLSDEIIGKNKCPLSTGTKTCLNNVSNSRERILIVKSWQGSIIAVATNHMSIKLCVKLMELRKHVY